jgi:hypothetical protein
MRALYVGLFAFLSLLSCRTYLTVAVVPTERGVYRIARLDPGLSDEAELCRQEGDAVVCKKVNMKFPD